MRATTTLLAALAGSAKGLVLSAPKIRSAALHAAPVVRGRTLMSSAEEQQVKAVITSMVEEQLAAMNSKKVETIGAYMSKFTADGAIAIRPSGNPLPYANMKDMWISDDVVATQAKLVSIDSTRVFAGGLAAVATYTTHDKFSYKGTPNDDLAVWTAVLEKVGTTWKVVHGHRATGQPPK